MATLTMYQIGDGDGYMRDVGETFTRRIATAPEKAGFERVPASRPNFPTASAKQPVERERAGKTSASGRHETPREWWEAQSEFYGRPIPSFPGF